MSRGNETEERRSATGALTALGLNNLEAQVYLFLLTNEPQTAYRIGKTLAKPTANVYKAIESLAQKGAVLRQEGAGKLCAAVPAAEFLQLIRGRFRKKTERAASLLGHLHPEYDESSVYRLENVDLVLQRCRTMLAACRVIAVVDAFPELLKLLQADLAEAAARGVEVLVQAYEEIDIPGVKTVLTGFGDASVRHWKSQQINVVVDGREHVLALMNMAVNRVYQAVWSRSLYLSCILHAGLIHEQTILRMMAVRDDHRKLKEILDEPRFFKDKKVPGQNMLVQRFIKSEGSEGL